VTAGWGVWHIVSGLTIALILARLNRPAPAAA